MLLGGQGGMMIAFVFAMGINFFSYWFSDKIVLRMYKAQEVSEARAAGAFCHGAPAYGSSRPAHAKTLYYPR